MTRIAALLVTLLACVLVQPVQGQTSKEARDAAIAQVVMIVDGSGEDSLIRGAGIIVGFDHSSVYIATAAHVVTAAEGEIGVRLFSEATTYQARIFPESRPEGEGDLAVLMIDRNPAVDRFLYGLDFAILSPLDTQTMNVPAATIGGSGGQDWAFGGNETLRFADRDFFDVQSDAGEGQSGGGLFNEAWELIGMPVNRSVDSIRARSMTVVLQDLRAWEIPIRLTRRAPNDRARGANEIARERAAAALALGLADRAADVRNRGLDFALSHLLAIEALRRSRSWSIDHAVRAGMAVLPVQRAAFDHGDEVGSISISRDSRYVATTSGDGYTSGGGVRVWSIDGTEIRALRRAEPGPVAFSNDSRFLAVGSRNGSLSIQSAPDGRVVAHIRVADADRIEPIRISPSGRFVVFSAFRTRGDEVSDAGLHVWTIASPRQLLRYDSEDSLQFLHVFIDAEDRLFVKDGYELRTWRLGETQRPVETSIVPPVGARPGSFRSFVSPNFRYHATIDHRASAYAGPATVIDTQAGGQVVARSAADVREILFSEDNSVAVFELGDNVMRVVDLTTGATKGEIRNLGQPTISADHRYIRSWDGPGVFDTEIGRLAAWVPGRYPAFSADGRYLAVADGRVARLVELPPATADARFRVPCVASQSELATSGSDLLAGCFRSLHRWNPSTGETDTLLEADRSIYSIAPDPHSGGILIGTNVDELGETPPGLHLLRESGELTLVARIHSSLVDLELSATGNYLAAAARPDFQISGESGLLLLRRESGQFAPLALYGGDRAPVAVAFTPDEACIAVAGNFSSEVVTVGPTLAPATRAGASRSVSFSADGRYLALTRFNGTSILERRGDEGCVFDEVRTWPSGGRDVNQAVFGPSGTALVISVSGGDQRVIDALSGEELAARLGRVDSQNEMVTSLFSSDGRFIFSFDADGINRWGWQLDDVLADACSRLSRNLTEEEWREYFGTEVYRKTCPALP